MISKDRLNHMLSVAKLMKKECLNNGYSNDYAEDMFTLGLVHDIGYEFCEHSDHGRIGAELLERQGFKYTNEIKYHGIPNCNFTSKELDLLNWADMHINIKGEYVTFEERLQDIKSRRGENSREYIGSLEIINSLRAKGYD